MNLNFKLLIKYTILVFVVLCLVSQGIVGQNIHKDNSKIKPFTIAEELFIQGKYYEAISYYERALQETKYKDDYKLKYHLAECYRVSRQYVKAEDTYHLVYGKSPLKYPLSIFWMAKMQKANEKYKDASDNFKIFSENKKVDILYIDEAKREITLCESAVRNKLDMPPTLVELFDPEIGNGLAIDRATMKHDTLWYVSAVKSGENDKIALDEMSGTYKDFFVSRLFYSVAGKNEKWKKGTQVEIPVENKRTDVISPFFDPITGNLFLTKCNDNNCAIFMSKFVNGELSIPVKLEAPVNIENSSSKDPMPVIIKNIEYLFFVSDRNKDSGFDIFYCTIEKNGKISNVQNIGKDINTKYDEHSPFYDPTLGTLYFSSRGHNSFGEYDIFYVKGDPATGWGKVINMGFPVNSGADDYYYYHYRTGNVNHAFFSSNRPTKEDELYGTVCDNLYQYNFSIGNIVAESPPLMTLKCQIFDETDKSRLFDDVEKYPLTEDTVRLYQRLTDKLIDKKYSFKTNTVTFHLKRDSAYLIEVNKKDYYSTIVKLNAISTDTIIIREIFMNKIIKPEIAITKEEIKPRSEPRKIDRAQLIQPKDFTFPVIYFDFGKSDLKKKETGKLNDLADDLMKRSALVIYVESYTDNIDSKNFNIVLSRKRSASVIDFLISRGIEKDRLISQWYGEDKPAATNENDEGRALNRRTEFAIISDMTNIRRGQMTTGDEVETANTIVSKKELGTDIDEKVFEELLQKQGHTSKIGLYYRVQIGTFRYSDANKLDKLSQFAYQQSKINIKLSIETEGDFKKYVTSQFATLNEANDYKVLIRETAIKDAFIVPYYRGNRIKMSELIFLFLEK